MRNFFFFFISVYTEKSCRNLQLNSCGCFKGIYNFCQKLFYWSVLSFIWRKHRLTLEGFLVYRWSQRLIHTDSARSPPSIQASTVVGSILSQLAIGARYAEVLCPKKKRQMQSQILWEKISKLSVWHVCVTADERFFRGLAGELSSFPQFVSSFPQFVSSFPQFVSSFPQFASSFPEFVSSFPCDNTVYPDGPLWIVISVGAVYAPPPPPPLRGRCIKFLRIGFFFKLFRGLPPKWR
jgi:hypothetical protein